MAEAPRHSQELAEVQDETPDYPLPDTGLEPLPDEQPEPVITVRLAPGPETPEIRDARWAGFTVDKFGVAILGRNPNRTRALIVNTDAALLAYVTSERNEIPTYGFLLPPRVPIEVFSEMPVYVATTGNDILNVAVLEEIRLE